MFVIFFSFFSNRFFRKTCFFFEINFFRQIVSERSFPIVETVEKPIGRFIHAQTGGASGEKGRGNVLSLIVHPDILGCIFQSNVANQASVMALYSLMVV